MNGDKYNPEEINKNQDGQYNPNMQKSYDKDTLKHGKSDEEIELDIDAENEKMEEEEENA